MAHTAPHPTRVSVRLHSELLRSVAIEARRLDMRLDEFVIHAIVSYLVDLDDGVLETLEIVGDPETFPHDYEAVMTELERIEEAGRAVDAAEAERGQSL